MADASSELRLCHDAARCTASGVCRSKMPERFRKSEGGALELARSDVSPGELADVRDVVLACPSGALHLDGDPLYDFPNVGP